MDERIGLSVSAAEVDRKTVIDAYNVDRKAAHDLAVIEYFCADSLVLIVWNHSGSLLYYSPEYRISRRRIATDTNAAGVANRSSDGVGRRWPERAGWVDEWREQAGEYTLVTPATDENDGPLTNVSLGLDLNCRHGVRRLSYRELVKDVDAHRRGIPGRYRV